MYNMNKENALELLFKYFKYEYSSLLEILDIPSETAAKRGGYTGVTAGYLMTYVVPGITTDLFIECINELMSKQIVSKLRCSNINKLVFEKYFSDYDHFTNTHPVSIEDLKISGISLAEQYKTNDMLDEEE